MSDNNAEKIDRRQQLLDVAERLFAQKGYEAVSIRDLASEAGVNVAMVSYYFGSKDKLFEALIESKMPRTRERLEELAASGLSPWEKLSQVIDMYAEKFFAGRAFHRVVMREMSLQQRPEHVNLIAGYMERNIELIRGFIVEGQEKGIFRYVDVELTIATIFGSLSTIINNRLLVCMMTKEAEEIVYNEQFKNRFKNHLKALLQAHLVIAGQT